MKPDKELRKAQQKESKLLALVEVTRKIHGTLDLDHALQLVLDSALHLSDMQRGFIMLFDDAGDLQFRKGRNAAGKSLGRDEFEISTTLVEKALTKGDLYYFLGKSEFSSESVTRLQIGSGLCIPLFSNRATSGSSKMIAMLYLDSRRLTNFGTIEEQIIGSLATQASLALENAMLYELATRDALTRLYQRHYFENAAFSEWKRSQRHKHPLSILMLDIDYFKQVNDTFGHEKGDQVLRRVAAVLKSVCREEDLPARYGGEEFIVLLPETEITGALTVASRIQEALKSTPVMDDRPVTVSIGVAAHPASGSINLEDLMKIADEALYEAKEKGRNRIASRPPQ